MHNDRRVYALFFCFWGTILSAIVLAVCGVIALTGLSALLFSVCCWCALVLIVYGGEE